MLAELEKSACFGTSADVAKSLESIFTSLSPGDLVLESDQHVRSPATMLAICAMCDGTCTPGDLNTIFGYALCEWERQGVQRNGVITAFVRLGTRGWDNGCLCKRHMFHLVQDSPRVEAAKALRCVPMRCHLN